MSKKPTKPMLLTMRCILEGVEFDATPQTINALKKRKLIDSASKLTYTGRCMAIRAQPLNKQCISMNIGYAKIELPTSSLSPEFAALKYFSEKGYRGISAEGTPILLLIKATILDFLAKNSEFETREDCCRRYTEAHLQRHLDKRSEIIDQIAKTKRRHIRRNLNEILSVYEPPSPNKGLSINLLLELYELLGTESITAIATLMLDDPYEYRKGWPDLIIWWKNNLRWIEVKTTDKFHDSQITTIGRFQHTLPGTIEVAKVITVKRTSWFSKFTKIKNETPSDEA